ncbi:MAG: ATP12 family protein [Paracoccaceae bacterium]
MSEWTLKRFWKSADIEEQPNGFSVLLDGRSIKTPAKASLVLPSLWLARAIAAEWDAQEETVNPAEMPFTRSANAAIDKVAVQHEEVATMLSDYGDNDLLCYRAEGPAKLVARQAAVWDPYLDWAADTLQARLMPRVGLMHKAQSPEALSRLHAKTVALDAFELAAFHDLVSMTGSLVLGFAALGDAREPQEIWSASRLDEDWQIEQWGADEEAESVANRKNKEFLHAKSFYDARHTT